MRANATRQHLRQLCGLNVMAGETQAATREEPLQPAYAEPSLVQHHDLEETPTLTSNQNVPEQRAVREVSDSENRGAPAPSSKAAENIAMDAATTEEPLQPAYADPSPMEQHDAKETPTLNAKATVLQECIEDLDAEDRAVYDSWARRRESVADLAWHEFEDWKWENESRFGDWQPTLNFGTMVAHFESKKKLSRTRAGTNMTLGDRIRQGREYFDPEYLQYNPQECDNMGLFFTFLLELLPLERVQPGANGKKPRTTTLDGFHHKYSARYSEWLGPRPTLWQWQSVTDWFLKTWCPEGKRSDFRWKDCSRADGNWTLSASEIEEIAYAATYYYAFATLQYEKWLADSK